MKSDRAAKKNSKVYPIILINFFLAFFANLKSGSNPNALPIRFQCFQFSKFFKHSYPNYHTLTV